MLAYFAKQRFITFQWILPFFCALLFPFIRRKWNCSAKNCLCYNFQRNGAFLSERHAKRAARVEEEEHSEREKKDTCQLPSCACQTRRVEKGSSNGMRSIPYNLLLLFVCNANACEAARREKIVFFYFQRKLDGTLNCERKKKAENAPTTFRTPTRREEEGDGAHNAQKQNK